jgi:Fe-Mn family superoxide dismutase
MTVEDSHRPVTARGDAQNVHWRTTCPSSCLPLPYDTTALEPYLSAETFEYHYGKHHKAYVDNLNELIEGTDGRIEPLEDIILSGEGASSTTPPRSGTTRATGLDGTGGGGGPDGCSAGDAVNEAFGSADAFRRSSRRRLTASSDRDGRGCARRREAGHHGDRQRRPADEARQDGMVTCDVWEHAYYIDYRNKRPDYVDTFLQHLINWDAVSAGLS